MISTPPNPIMSGNPAATGTAILVVLTAALSACDRASTGQSAGENGTESADGPTRARADLAPTQGNSAEGDVVFTRVNGVMQIAVNLTDAESGRHAVHIHKAGDCSAADASSAGAHFSPDDNRHGSPEDAADQHHAGDLGNVKVGDQNIGTGLLTDEQLNFDGRYGVIKRAVIVHAGPDDFSTQPGGDSGARIACGVIEPF